MQIIVITEKYISHVLQFKGKLLPLVRQVICLGVISGCCCQGRKRKRLNSMLQSLHHLYLTPQSPLPHSSSFCFKFLFQVSSLHHLYLTSQVSVLTALFKINLKPSFLKVAFSFFVFLPFLELLLQHMEVPRQGV